MAPLSIIIAPDPRLKGECQQVSLVDNETRKLMDDMLEVMRSSKGIGLAAPQVGVHKQVLVIDTAREGEKPAALCMANPEIIWASPDQVSNEEGCLSLPQYFAEVTRPAKITARYLDYDNQPHEITADGLMSRCIQHEMDHLKGILFVDHISSLKRGIILRKLSKLKKQQEAAQ